MRIRSLFDRRTAKNDITAGLTLAVESVPDGMAVGALAAINPVTGVYAYMVGGFSGAFFTSSVSLSIQATSAMALIVAGVAEVTSGGPAAADALLVLTLLTGIFMVAAGLLRLGSALRFVPDSVMSAFTQAVGFSIILGQLSNLTGYQAEGANKPMQAVDLLRNFDQVDLASLATGVIAGIVMMSMQRTRFNTLGILLAMFGASLVPIVLDWTSVEQVQDLAQIPGRLPLPTLPGLSDLPTLIPALIAPALALAVVGLVQGAAVTHAFPNPDGSKPDPSGDFTGQGLANVVTGFFQGMPVGGSFSATAILANAGARTRFANIVAGLGIAGLLLVLRDAIGLLAMPALAGFLIVLGIGLVNPGEIAENWRLGGLYRWGMAFLVLVALFVSLQASVFVGVALSVLLYVMRESSDIVVKRAVHENGQLISEVDVEPELAPDSIITLHFYGSLFFASAQYFESQLPQPTEHTRNTVVILDLRGQRDLDPTTLNMLTDYADELRANECRLILADVGESARSTLEKTNKLAVFGSDGVFPSSEHIQESVSRARAEAQRWLETRS